MKSLLFLTLTVLLLSGCQGASPQPLAPPNQVAQATAAAPTAQPATATPVIPSTEPSPTPVPPTATATKPPPTVAPTATMAPTATVPPTPSPLPPTNTPAAPEVEEKATQYEDILGEWLVYAPGIGRAKQIFLADGGCGIVYAQAGTTCSFVDGKLFIDMPPNSHACPDQDAYYDVWVTRQAGEITKLRFKAVGVDPCEGRSLVLSGRRIVRFEE